MKKKKKKYNLGEKWQKVNEKKISEKGHIIILGKIWGNTKDFI